MLQKVAALSVIGLMNGYMVNLPIRVPLKIA